MDVLHSKILDEFDIDIVCPFWTLKLASKVKLLCECNNSSGIAFIVL